MFNYCFFESCGFFKIKEIKNASYCLQFYFDNVKVYELKYQKNNFFWFDLRTFSKCQNNAFLKIRCFIKVGDLREATTLAIGSVSNNKITTSNIKDFKELNKEEVCLFLKFISSDYEILIKHIYTLLKQLDKKYLNYFLSEFESLIDRCPFDDREFLLGILYYRVSSFDRARSHFMRTKDKTNCFEKFGDALFLYDNNFKPAEVFKKNITILISCDVGYLYAYKSNLISSLNFHDQLIHIHVVLKDKNYISKITDDFIDYSERVKFSFELLTNQDKKVYSSISRFIQAEYIINKYNSPILIVDIDVDFSKKCVENVVELNFEKIGLFINQNQLPWKKILAGFCYFPNNSISFYFLKSLNKYFSNVCRQGNYYWTIDQIGLTSMYDSMVISHESFENLRNYNSIRLKQVPDRHLARKFSLKFKDC